MARSTVGVLSTLPKLTRILAAKTPEINFVDVFSDTHEKLLSNKVNVIIADFDLLANIMYDLPSDIKWVQGTWAGADKLLKKYNPDKKFPYIVTRFSGSHFGTMMAEYVISNLVSWERNFHHLKTLQEQQLWEKSGKVSDYRIIRDMKIAVLGVGVIGKHVASALKLLGASQIWGLVNKIPHTKETYIDFYRTSSEIGEVLEKCDVIVNILPNTKETAGVLNVNNLSVCNKAVFINVGRGSVISEEDLVAALNKQYLSAAILDVFYEEPLPQSSPLWHMEQVTITPHVAAVTRSQDVAELFSEHWVIWKEGKCLPNVIDFIKGY